MTLAKITPSNALQAAHYLLNLDKEAIDSRYHLDANEWISPLKEALARYEAHVNTCHGKLLSQAERDKTQYQLISLVRYVKNVVCILTPEVQAQFFLSLQTPSLS